MRPVQKTSTLTSLGDVLVNESARYGPIITLAVMALISFGGAYLIYSNFLSGWMESNEAERQAVIRKEIENEKTERMLAGEPQFRGEFKKIVDLYEEAKPLLPQE